MRYRHRCADCGNTKQFYTVAHVAQDWLVDEFGDFIKAESPCVEVVARPNNDNEWECAVCHGINVEHIEIKD